MLLVLAVALSAPAGQAVAGTEALPETWVDLGLMRSDAMDINDAGLVVGVDHIWGTQVPFALDLTTGETTRLTGRGAATAVNNLGLVGGNGFLWDPSTGAVDAIERPELPPNMSRSVRVNALNDAGMVVGTEYRIDFSEPREIVDYSQGFLYDHETATYVELPDAHVNDISTDGTIVGSVRGGAAAWWDPAGEVHLIELPGGAAGTALAINNAGTLAVGTGTTGSWVYDFGTGVATLIGSLDPTDVNDAGLVTMNSGTGAEATGHAYLYDSTTGVLTDTQTIGAGANSYAAALNNHGIAVGNAFGIDESPEDFIVAAALTRWTFADVPPWHPFVTDIDWAATEGITTGFPDDTYRPMEDVTRQAMSAFLYRLDGSPAFTPPATSTFPDVPTDHPFFAEIEWLVAEGVTTGFDDGGYHPGDDVTRQSMSAFLYRLAGEPAFTPPGSPMFPDVAATHPFFAEIEWMAAEGLTTGFPDGTFRPGSPVTRQAMSVFMHRYADGPGAP